MSENFKAHILVIIATFLIAGSFIVSKKLAGIIDPISLTLFRFVFASIVLAPIIFIKQKYRTKVRETFKRALVISLFYSLYFIGLFKALEYTTALNTGTLFTLVPLLTAFFAIFVFKQTITLFQFFIYLVGIVGTCMVVFKGDLQLFLNLSLNYGDVIFLFAIVTMALYSISAKHFYKEGDEVLVLTFMTLIGGIIWMGLALVFFDIPLQWEKINGDLFLYMSYLAIAATLFTVYLNQKATIILGPKKVMAYIYINPAVVALLMFLFYSQSISLWICFGIVISSLATIILLYKN
ncbi:DMT family transporter [Halarcobacter ebronensis]|uniref:EamA family transporter n=1 Tax=Halarcobacter ebronensis TaxID=1462615 RepID=A0A4Q1AKE2_9BACT|nr:DMT family transporter [Halarcobacter ebronensis]QKF81852.1 EamA/RhaT family transporter [Halarcobacter ebronensis]RXK02118.1 EamA family transporter [Halarcobacter ebronensis]